jgi:DNA repair protein RecO (recombination protein O)
VIANLTPSFVLHRRPYRNSSALVDLLTLSHGRMCLVARGVFGSKPRRAGQLQPFRRLLCAWAGRGELQTLTELEDVSHPNALPRGTALTSGLYMNELCMLLLQRGEPVPDLFGAYRDCIDSLVPDNSHEPALRRFEWILLQELGVAVSLERDVEGRPIEPEPEYAFLPERGFRIIDGPSDGICGDNLLRFARGDGDVAVARALRPVTRRCVDALLAGRPLRSRELARARIGQGGNGDSTEKRH